MIKLHKNYNSWSTPPFPIISTAYHIKVRLYPHTQRLSRCLYFYYAGCISPSYKAKFVKKYNYESRERYVCISRIRWKYTRETLNLHWIPTGWCLQEIIFKDQGGMWSLLTMFSWPYLFPILLPRGGCWSPAEGTLAQETEARGSRSLRYWPHIPWVTRPSQAARSHH